MAIPNLPDEQIRKALKELEQATHNHDQWAEMLFGTLICRLPPDERDISPDAHRRCRFGQWYYRFNIADVEQNPGFEEIGLAHERMHQFAGSLLRASMEDSSISISDYERFVSALKRMRLEIETVRRELEDALYNLDPLTGTPSRVGMLTKLREQGELVKRSVHSCVIAMIDFDRFKSVNDRYGHLVGDKVLVDTARHIMAHLRPYDKVFRYGGEEFLICLPDTDLKSGSEAVDRLRKEIGAIEHQTEGKATINVTVSAGLTLLDPDASVETSNDLADKALYAAKARGRNTAVHWDPSMDEELPDAKALSGTR
jgi:diguanylate cyclase (GGDEF)-like protein